MKLTNWEIFKGGVKILIFSIACALLALAFAFSLAYFGSENETIESADFKIHVNEKTFICQQDGHYVTIHAPEQFSQIIALPNGVCQVDYFDQYTRKIYIGGAFNAKKVTEQFIKDNFK